MDKETKLQIGIGIALVLILAVFLSIRFIPKEPLESTKMADWTVCQRGCDFTGIQDAIEAAKPGDVIRIKAGMYRENLEIKKSLSLEGEDRDKSVVKGVKEGYPVVWIESDGEVEVTIEGLKIVGNWTKSSSESQDYSEAERKLGIMEGWFEEIGRLYKIAKSCADDARDICPYGIVVKGKGKVIIRDSGVSANTTDGIRIWDSAKVDLINTRVSDNGLNGIFAWDSAQLTVRDSTISNNGYAGIGVMEEAKATIMNSTISGSKSEGIHVGNSAQADIINSDILGNDYDGIDVYDSSRVTIKDSTISKNGDHGIELYGSPQVTIENNRVTGNDGYGAAFYLKECGYDEDNFDGSVEGKANQFKGNKKGDVCPAELKFLMTEGEELGKRLMVGKGEETYNSIQAAIDAAKPGDTIEVRAGTYEENLKIKKSLTLKGEGMGEVAVKGAKAGYPVIWVESNEEIRVTIEGIAVTEAKGKGKACAAEYPQWICPNGIEIRGKARITIQDVRVSGHGRNGIYMRDSANATIQDCTVSDNEWYGIFMRNSTNAMIQDSTISRNVAGIFAAGSADAVVQNSTVSSNGINGIWVADLAKATFRDTIISGNGGNGIFLSSKSQATIQESRIINNIEWGIAAFLRKCGLGSNDFAGQVELSNTEIVGNKKGDVCLP